jgi:hypothetical protein
MNIPASGAIAPADTAFFESLKKSAPMKSSEAGGTSKRFMLSEQRSEHA